MRRVALNTHSRHLSIPRGWVIVGSALTSWLLFAMLWAGLTSLFSFVASSI